MKALSLKEQVVMRLLGLIIVVAPRTGTRWFIGCVIEAQRRARAEA